MIRESMSISSSRRIPPRIILLLLLQLLPEATSGYAPSHNFKSLKRRTTRIISHNHFHHVILGDSSSVMDVSGRSTTVRMKSYPPRREDDFSNLNDRNEEDSSIENGNSDDYYDNKSGVTGKFRSWLRNENRKIVEHIPVPTSYEEEEEDDYSGSIIGNSYSNINADSVNNAVVEEILNKNVPEWFRQKQIEAMRAAQSLENTDEDNSVPIPSWLQERMKLVSGDIEEDVRINAARNIRSKQKELFRKLARGEISVSEDIRRKEGKDMNSFWDEKDSPDWMVEQKQTKEADAWIQKKEMEAKVQSTRDNLIRDQEKEKDMQVPDWFKQKEAEMMATLEAATAATESVPSIFDSRTATEKSIGEVDDNSLVDDDWFRQKEKRLSTEKSWEKKGTTDEMPEWLKQKEQEMIDKLKKMEANDFDTTESPTSSSNLESISADQRREEILATLKSGNVVDDKNWEQSKRKDRNSPDVRLDVDETSTRQSNPNTPFFQDNSSYLSEKSDAVPAGDRMGSARKRPSVMDHAPDWLQHEMSTDKDDYIEEKLEEDRADEDFVDSLMFRDPSVDWIRSDPEELYRIEKKYSSFSSFDPRWRRLMETGVTLSASELNALFDHDDIHIRLHAQNKPDSAYGAIFRLEGALIDTSKMQEAVWIKLAEKYGFREPLPEDIAKAQMIPPDQAIRRIFYWTQDMLESREMALDHYDILQEVFDEILDGVNHDIDNNDTSPFIFPIVDGAIQWLERLREVEVPCCVISQFDNEKLEKILNITNLATYFPHECRVSANSGYDEEEQEYLGAALRIKRRPDHCAVFDSTPNSAVSAHDVEMRAISIMSLYPMYELRAADMIVETFDNLSVIDIRRLFWDLDYEPDIQLERVSTSSDNPKRIKRWVDWDFPEQ